MAVDKPEKPVEWPLPWMPAFLAALRNSANVRASCQAAGIHRSMAAKARGKWVTFAVAWDDAVDDALDILEAVAWERARTQSDFLLWRLLATQRRDKFGDALVVRLDLTAEAERIARERGLPPERAAEIVSLAERLKAKGAS